MYGSCMSHFAQYAGMLRSNSIHEDQINPYIWLSCMSSNPSEPPRPGQWILLLGLPLLLSGCGMTLFDPKGDVGVQEKTLIVLALAIMLAVVIPVIALTLWFAWRYRETN